MTGPALCRVGIVLVLAGSACRSASAQDAGAANEALQAAFEVSAAEELPADVGTPPANALAQPYHLSLEEARSRTLQNSVIMDLAASQVAAKCYALQAARKDYWPKLLNSFAYFHFDRDLGTVLTTPGILNPAMSIAVPVIEQDSTIYTAAAIQPITALLKVREAVNISAADVGAAEAQRDFARRELCKGVEQLYFGILATQRIKAGLEQAVAGAQHMVAQSATPDAQISLVQVQQSLLAAEGQFNELNGQMNALVGLPPQTQLQLEEPPAPTMPFDTVDEAVPAAVGTSPKIREARRQVDKAEAALRLAQADYLPNVMAYGMYVNQDSTPIIQEDFTGVGVSATYMLEWGKKNDVYRASKATVVLARQNLQKEIQDTSLAAAKAFLTASQAEQALVYAQQLAALNRQVQPPADPFQFKAAVQARLEAELGAVKAELDHRTAVVELRSITGQAECP